VILSLQNKSTTADALRRSGLTCRLFEGELGHHAWLRPEFVAPLGYAASVLSIPAFLGSSASISIFGGSPSLEQAGSRMLTALGTLDPSVKQEGRP
jgi:hypothetical protein